MATESRQKWIELLADWMSSMGKLHQMHFTQWAELGLPDIRDLKIRAPDPVGIAKLQERWNDALDPELIAFLGVTDGWPLWLGSLCVSALPAGKIALLREAYPDAFDIAMAEAPSARKGTSNVVDLSRMELNSALVVSAPDARELVLSLASHETCFYYFDGMRVFRNFFEYMSYRKTAVWLSTADML